MGKRIGVCCIALGCLCLLAAVGLVLHNGAQERQAETASRLILEELRAEPERETPPREETASEQPTAEKEDALAMTADCIGILSIPVLELELPVLADWSYEKLELAPCRYHGSRGETDFVIAAHNYRGHFGRLSELQAKDLVFFTDLSGTDHCYEVVLLETLPPEATKEMITSGFDLSLYTCTAGGGSRVTARCTQISP